MNCALRHIGCNSIHVSDELQSNSASKSWRSQFMMRQHQFIHKNEQSKNRRRFILLLLLFSACNKGLGLAQVHLTGQMRCSHLVELSNSPLRTSPLGGEGFFCKPSPRTRFLNRWAPPLTQGRLFVQFYLNETASFYKPI